MLRPFQNAGLALVLGVAMATAGLAQGSQTGNLTGTVKTGEGEVLPGVTVTVSSGSMQGERVAVTGTNGDFIFKNLPPGVYKIVYALEGMQSVERSSNVPLGGTSRSDATLDFSTVEETIVITGEAPSALETTTTGANFETKTVDALPLPGNQRTLSSIADLAGGLTDNGTVAGQVTIGGAFAYDNVFLVNGVDVNDRYFGGANDLLVIEEAVEETQVLTNGVSAEYGRFSGGVINAITKSGGNDFAGSFRVDYNKPEWRDETPFEEDRNLEREGDLSQIYSATLGGPILRDRLWFFLAGRDFEADTAFTLPVSAEAGTNTNTQERYEFKLTGNLTSNHSLQGSYTDSESVNSLERQLNPLEMEAVSVDSTRINEAFVVAYNGVFTNSLFGEVRYSEKHFGFQNLGGSNPAIEQSPINGFVGTTFSTLNAPYFDATDPEDRDNEQLYGALSYFLSTESLGSHDFKGGVEVFNDIGVGGNSQSPTGYTFTTSYISVGDDVVATWDGSSLMYYWLATRGAKSEQETTSFFVNDRWSLNENFSFNLGARYEKIDTSSEVGVPSISSDSIVPRLGASYDVQGDGQYKIDVTYSEYSGKAHANQFGANSPAGNPAYAYGYYHGPEGVGNFAPAFDPANYDFANFSNPVQTTSVDPDLKTPRTKEFTVGGGIQIGNGGFLKAVYVNRSVSDFVETFTDTNSPLVAVQVGQYEADLIEVTRFENQNFSSRDYESIQLQGQFRPMDNWMVGGNWTYELANEGNFEGEAGQAPGAGSVYGDFPEVFPEDRYFPTGRFDNFQEHKVRLWSTYLLDFGRGGNMDIGGIFRYDSPLTYSYVSPNRGLSATQQALGEAAGYTTLPAVQNLFYGERGAGEFEDIYSLDLSLQYAIPVWKTLAPWIKFTATNVTNESNLITYDTRVIANTAAGAPRDSVGQPTTYALHPNHGLATSSASHQFPREYFFAAGIRF